MKNRWGIAACTLLLGLTAWGCAPAVKSENLGLIQPGVGIKELAIAETRDAVEKTWGQPDDVYENPFDKSNVIVAYHKKGVEVSYRGGSVDCVNLYPQKQDWQGYEGATQGGVWVNSSEKEVRQLLGKPVSEAPQALNYPGLTVFINEGKVDYLTVSATDTALSDSTLDTNGATFSTMPAAGADTVAPPTLPGGEPSAETITADDNPAADSIKRLRESAAKIE